MLRFNDPLPQEQGPVNNVGYQKLAIADASLVRERDVYGAYGDPPLTDSQETFVNDGVQLVGVLKDTGPLNLTYVVTNDHKYSGLVRGRNELLGQRTVQEIRTVTPETSKRVRKSLEVHQKIGSKQQRVYVDERKRLEATSTDEKGNMAGMFIDITPESISLRTVRSGLSLAGIAIEGEQPADALSLLIKQHNIQIEPDDLALLREINLRAIPNNRDTKPGVLKAFAALSHGVLNNLSVTPEVKAS